jgi:hypothetical protein
VAGAEDQHMTRTLDVLVIESQRHAADVAVDGLLAAGHRVHRCYDRHCSGFPCRAVTDPDDCPLDHAADVALLARRHPTPRPTPLEQPVTCAVRAGVPVVEVGPRRTFDPYADWLLTQTEDPAGAVPAVERAAEEALASLGRTVVGTIGPLLRDEDIDPADTACEIVREARDLHVRVRLPVDVDESLRQAVSVRTLAALHDVRGRYAAIGIAVVGPT